MELDWSAAGIPTVQFPSGRDRGQPEVDVFDLLKGSAREPMSSTEWRIFELLAPKVVKECEDVDWDLLQLLDPSQDRTWEISEPEQEPEVNWLAVDWSGNRLPHLKYAGPPSRRPGLAGRVRAGSYHKPVKPQMHRGSPKVVEAQTLDLSQLKLMLAATKRFPQPSKQAAVPRKNSWSVNRTAPRIIQPCGGGR